MYHLYFSEDNENWTLFNEEFYSFEDAKFYVNLFNSMYDPVKFKYEKT